MEKVVTVEVPDDFDSLDESDKCELMFAVSEADDGLGYKASPVEHTTEDSYIGDDTHGVAFRWLRTRRAVLEVDAERSDLDKPDFRVASLLGKVERVK